MLDILFCRLEFGDIKAMQLLESQTAFIFLLHTLWEMQVAGPGKDEQGSVSR